MKVLINYIYNNESIPIIIGSTDSYWYTTIA